MTGPSLFMVELRAADWAACVAWYTGVLGLRLALRDDERQFALLTAGGGRVAVKGGPPVPGTTALVFEVADLPAELARLAALGVTAESPVKVSPEGYRRAFVRDPEGHRVGLFDWGGEPPAA